MDQRMAAQFIAKRMGLSNEECDTLISGDMSPFFSKLQDNLSDPLTAALATSLFIQKSREKEVMEDHDYDRLLVRARKVVRRLKEQIEAADVMLNHIGRVFGACPACWGTNKLCETCHGQGKPGNEEPDMEQLLAWTEPSLKRLGMKIVKV